jgi:hypothetical protein
MPETQPSDTVVIHCSDPRFQLPFQDFLRGRLGLTRYALIAVPGGPQFLTLAGYLPKFSWVGWRWVKFVMDLSPVRRVILITHEDCRWYLDARFGQHSDIQKKQLADLNAVRAALRELLGNLVVECHSARLHLGQVIFETQPIALLIGLAPKLIFQKPSRTSGGSAGAYRPARHPGAGRAAPGGSSGVPAR